jgi:hypothetical protein
MYDCLLLAGSCDRTYAIPTNDTQNDMAPSSCEQNGVRSPRVELKSRFERSGLPCYKDSRAAVGAHIVMLIMATQHYA